MIVSTSPLSNFPLRLPVTMLQMMSSSSKGHIGMNPILEDNDSNEYKDKVPREDERWNFNKAVETGGGGSSR